MTATQIMGGKTKWTNATPNALLLHRGQQYYEQESNGSGQPHGGPAEEHKVEEVVVAAGSDFVITRDPSNEVRKEQAGLGLEGDEDKDSEGQFEVGIVMEASRPQRGRGGLGSGGEDGESEEAIELSNIVDRKEIHSKCNLKADMNRLNPVYVKRSQYGNVDGGLQ